MSISSSRISRATTTGRDARHWLALLAGLFLIILYPSSPLWAQDAIAFFYGNPDHVEALSLYDRVVIQPDQTTPETIQRLKTLGTTVYGYLSISELPQDALDATLQKALIGENKNWNAHIFDITHPTWQQHLLQTAKHYRDMGFDGVFLDTLDSYRLTSLSNTAQHAQAQGLVDIIQRLSAIFSGQVLINRGFDILESVSRYIQAVVTESVFYAYTPGPSPDPFQQHDAPLHVSTTKHITTANYFPTSPDERRWALNDLAKAKALNLEVIVIDYLEHHSQRYAHAAELIRLGFTPYVTNGLLNEYGVSTKTLIRNRVLALYDSTQNPLVESHVFTNLTLPFERAGYPMDFFDVRTNALPRPDTSRYAGVIIWLPNHSTLTQSPEFAEWIAAWHKASAILWINTPASRAIQNRLGFHFTPLPSTSNHSAWQFNDPRHLAGFENTLSSAGPVLNQTLHLRDPHRVLFSLTTPTGTAPLAAQMPWGVVAVSNSLFMTDPFKDVRWILNPATLIHDFLGLPALPTADATTESGRRIATAHIDGDGFPSRATLDKHPYTAEVILNEILTSYPDIPTTVSIIEGEISEQGLHPQTSSELEAIARRLFALPHVEIASHSFSHPFFWSRDPESVYAPLGQHLPLEDYDLDFTREIYGSIDYINRRLAPKNKKTAVFLWSGSADPTPDTVALTAAAGVENVNGGNTHVTKEKFLLSNISPTVAPFPPHAQVMAPNMNESAYTKLWTANFGGYQQAIETFELLDHQERLKSISIYYHMYSGESPASLAALKAVHDWVRTQDINPMWLSEYAKRARATHRLALGSPLAHLDRSPATTAQTKLAFREPTTSAWIAAALDLKTVRLPQRLLRTNKPSSKSKSKSKSTSFRTR